MTTETAGAPPDPRVVLDPAGIAATVRRLAGDLSSAYGDDLVLVSVLKGSLIFTSDLCRALSVHPLVDFIAVSPYVSGQRARIVKDITVEIEGVDVVLVHDIIDTGLSTSFLMGELSRRNPKTLSVCTLVDKPTRRLVPVEIDHIGIQVDDDFLIGYGLDFAGRYRNLRVIAAADPVLLSADPDCYRSWAHPFRDERE